jgi:hypothetical protein
MGKLYVGVDLGKSGSLIGLKDSKILWKSKMPLIGKDVDTQRIRRMLTEQVKTYGSIHLIMEKIAGVAPGARFNMNSLYFQSGLVEGLVAGLGIPFSRVAPQTWQKEMWSGTTVQMKVIAGDPAHGIPAKEKKDTKATSLIAARALYPDEDFLATAQSRVAHDGIVDAVLIATYAQRKGF